jgi:WD40 repeat protein
MRILRGYQKPVVALAVSPDGARLFSAAKGQNRAWVWDLAAGEVERKLNSYNRRIADLACSPDGTLLLAPGDYHGLTVWALTGKHPPSVFDTVTGFHPTVASHPDSRRAAFPFAEWSAQPRRFGVQVWDLAKGEQLQLLLGHTDQVHAVAISPSGALIASGSADRTVRLWDAETGQEVRCFREQGVPLRITFRPDGKRLAAATEDGVCVRDLTRGDRLETLSGHGGSVGGVGYSPDGKYLASAGGDGIARLYDAATNDLLGRRHLEIGKLGALAWLPDSSGLAAGGEKLIAVCDVAELLGTEHARPKRRGEPLSLAGHQDRVEGMRYSPDGRALVSWDRRGLRLWDLSGGAGQARPASPFAAKSCSVSAASWAPEGRRLAYCFGYLGYVIDARSGAVLYEPPAEQYGTRLSFTPSGRLFRVVRTGEAKLPGRLELLDAEDRTPLHSQPIRDDPHHLLAACFPCPDDRHLYFAVRRQGVCRWSPQTGEYVRLFTQLAVINHLAVSEDGQRFLTAAGLTATVRHLSDVGRLVEMKHPLLCSGAALLPGGRVLTGCYDGVVRVWDADSGGELFAFDLGMGRVYCLAVSPDFMTFAAGVEKGNRVVLMDVPE